MIKVILIYEKLEKLGYFVTNKVMNAMNRVDNLIQYSYLLAPFWFLVSIFATLLSKFR